MVKELPKFKGYTVDIRLREFRIVTGDAETHTYDIEFISFDSPKGQKLLEEMRAQQPF
jgi:hypothetical protein